MDNPYVERVAARMEADNAHNLLKTHWSSRIWWLIQGVAFRLDQFGLNRASDGFMTFMGPVCDWLAYRQSVFLRRWL